MSTLVLADLSDVDQRRIKDELEDGESIRWMGRPDPKKFALQYRWLSFFGIVGMPIPIYIIYIGFLPGRWAEPEFAQIVSLIVGLPFLFLSLICAITPLLGWRTARDAVYVITDSRAIEFAGNKTVRSFRADVLKSIYRTEIADGSGDIHLGKEFVGLDEDGRSTPMTTTISLFVIPADPGVRYVEGLLRQIVSKHK